MASFKKGGIRNAILRVLAEHSAPGITFARADFAPGRGQESLVTQAKPDSPLTASSGLGRPATTFRASMKRDTSPPDPAPTVQGHSFNP
jgi:hypothetical protein